MEQTLLAALLEAWKRIEPILAKNPNELAHRRSRRRLGILRGVHRAWCLSVKATDTRMSPMDIVMVPDRPVVWDHEAHCYRYREHTVTLDSGLLRWLCRPVSIPFPGVTRRELAHMLGVNVVSVANAMRRGRFEVRRVKGLGGVRGHPVPILSCQGLLDPAGIPLGRMADVEWGTIYRWVSEHVPDGISQTLLRRPMFLPYRGQLRFRGWKWVCPGCRKEALVLHYPLPIMHPAPFVRMAQSGDPDDVETPPPCFACRTCHRLRYGGRVDYRGWNELVTQLSGGLLYGREVKRPIWFTTKRIKPFAPRPGRAPSKRFPELEELLVKTTLTYPAIARKMGLRSVEGWVSQLYRRRAVHTRQELREKCGEKR